MIDWRREIVRLVEIKQSMSEVDSLGLWEFHLPKVAASTDELNAAEAALGVRVDPQYRNFLAYANGWPSFFQSVDLFGTDDLLGGPRLTIANGLLDAIEPVVFESSGLDPAALVPIAATTVDLDVFVMPIINGELAAPVVWLAGYEIDRFASFDVYVASMIEYNARELQALIDRSAT